MTATMTIEDVEHLAASLDAPFGDLDERDQELLQAIFALAGEAAAAHDADEQEVTGFSISWHELPAVQAGGPGPSSPLFNSFNVGLNVGASGPLGAIHRSELNPQPLPP